jgi:hypothetical protein
MGDNQEKREFDEQEWDITDEFGGLRTKFILMSGGGVHIAGVSFTHDEVATFAHDMRTQLDNADKQRQILEKFNSRI